jgi:hypothetical protein
MLHQNAYQLSNQAMNLLNAVEVLADTGNGKAETMLQKLFDRVKRRNAKARESVLPASFVLAEVSGVISLENEWRLAA